MPDSARIGGARRQVYDEGSMKAAGDILLIACYELGHQPLGIAWPAAVLAERGYAPATLDVSVEPFDPEKAARARLVAISVPMHTALRVGVTVAGRVRAVNPSCHICFFGLYASLNAEYLLAHGIDSVVGGERAAAGRSGRCAGRGRGAPCARVATAQAPSGPYLRRQPLPQPSRASLPALTKYARLERAGRRRWWAMSRASRGCLHRCRHCPIPPVYGGRFFAVPRDTVLADIRQQVAAGATHITFGDPDFLNGPGQALAVARRLHAECPTVTFDFTAKVEHLLRHRRLLPELAVLGGLFVVSAVESLSDTVLTHLAKVHTWPDVTEALRAAREASISGPPGSPSRHGQRSGLRRHARLRRAGSWWITWTRCSRSASWSPRLAASRARLQPSWTGSSGGLLVPVDTGSPRGRSGRRRRGGGGGRREEDPAVTFDRVRARWAIPPASRAPAAGLPATARARRAEPWFC